MSIRALNPTPADDAQPLAVKSRPGRSKFRPSDVALNAAERLKQESFDALLLGGTTIALVLIGLVMVFSSSMVNSLVNEGDAFTIVIKQLLFGFSGLGAMLVISRLPQLFFMRIAWILLGATTFLQVLVIATPLGITVAGNTNWLNLFGFQLQPSEFIKVALVIWLGMMAERKKQYQSDFKRGLLPMLLGAAVPMGLVALGGDLGTVMVMAVFVLFGLILSGIPARLFIAPVLVLGAVGFLMATGSSNRMARIMSFMGGSNDASDYLSGGWQLQHGMFALANGGLFGVGIGNSTAKWSWLPAADNDFIFAIIGEELGLIGALVVLALFGLLCYAMIRIFNHAATPFGRTVTATVLVWIMVQATANIAVVLGIIPVLGVPLPLVSSGGTALLSNLVAIGVVLAVARSTPRANHSTPVAAVVRSSDSVWAD